MLAFGAGDACSNQAGATPLNWCAMKASCEMVLDLGSPEKAQTLLKAIELDNGPYVKAKLEGSCLRLNSDAATLGSLLCTVEDLLACLRLAESVGELKP